MQIGVRWERALKEAYEKEALYFHVNDVYAKKFIQTVTPKFYARHEAFGTTEADPVLVKEIKLFLDNTPKEKYEWPMTENQRYGWFSKPLADIDRNDERFYFPSRYDDITKQGLKIRKDKTMMIPKFTGIPWKF